MVLPWLSRFTDGRALHAVDPVLATPGTTTELTAAGASPSPKPANFETLADPLASMVESSSPSSPSFSTLVSDYTWLNFAESLAGQAILSEIQALVLLATDSARRGAVAYKTDPYASGHHEEFDKVIEELYGSDQDLLRKTKRAAGVLRDRLLERFMHDLSDDDDDEEEEEEVEEEEEEADASDILTFSLDFEVMLGQDIVSTSFPVKLSAASLSIQPWTLIQQVRLRC